MAMSLPMDFSTALWWRSVPVWEWQPLPPSDNELAQANGEAALSSSPDGAAACAAPAASLGASLAATPGSERDGYRLVLKGYQISASLFWYPSDSPLSRPWLRSDDAADQRRPRTDEGDAAARAAQLRAAADHGVEPT
jgi:hypothetical protein